MTYIVPSAGLVRRRVPGAGGEALAISLRESAIERGLHQVSQLAGDPAHLVVVAPVPDCSGVPLDLFEDETLSEFLVVTLDPREGHETKGVTELLYILVKFFGPLEQRPRTKRALTLQCESLKDLDVMMEELDSAVGFGVGALWV